MAKTDKPKHKLQKEYNNYMYFSFDADIFEPDILTEELAIIPTTFRIKKNPIPVSTAWQYRIDAGNDLNLSFYLEKLIDVFEPKINTINALKRKYNLTTRLQFVIYIDINPETSKPSFGLNQRIIDFLYKTETVVDYDDYTI